MKTAIGLMCAAVAVQLASAQIVERPRPAGWENLVFGGRFMDRFEQPEVIGDGWTSACWGGGSHSSKNITIPVNPGRRIETFKKTRQGWEARIKSGRLFFATARTDGTKLK